MLRTITPCLALLALLGCGVTQSKSRPQDSGPSPEGYYSLKSKGFELQYKVDGEHLLCILSGATTGWIALGIAPSSMMKDANFIIGYVKDGQGFIRDDYGTEHTDHASDLSLRGTSDLTLHAYEEKDGRTGLVFSLPLDSGDMFDQALKPGNSYKVIFGAGPQDDFDSYHRSHASGTIKL